MKDMYKEALVSIMIGSNFKLIDEGSFWECLLPQELETQLWIKLKLAAYEHRKPNQSAGYFAYPKPSFFQAYTL